MKLKEILENAFSTQIAEYKHNTRDYVTLLGSISGILCITTGITLFLMLSVAGLSIAYIALGLIWASFGAMTLAGVSIFHVRKKQGALVILMSGVMGMPFGCGFFLGSALAVFAGALAIKDMLDKRKRRK